METLVRNNTLFPSVNTFFDDVFSKNMFGWNEKNFSGLGSTLPSVNMKETDAEIEIELAAPGMKKEDFKIEIDNDNGILSIACEREEEKMEENKNEKYTRREFSYQSFTRSFSLPHDLKEDEIEATYIDGLLHVVIPRNLEIKDRHSKVIPVK